MSATGTTPPVKPPSPTPADPGPTPEPTPNPPYWVIHLPKPWRLFSKDTSRQGLFNTATILMLAVLLFRTGGCTFPWPTPGPTPPGPIPTPVVGRIRCVYVVSRTNTTPAEAAIRTSSAIRAAATQLNVTYLTRDDQETEMQAPTWKAQLASGLPQVVFMDSTNKIVAAKIGPSEDDIISTMKKLRGN